MSAFFRSVCVLLACAGAISVQAQIPVEVVVRTQWKSTPLLLEIAEFVGNHSSAQFWEFVEDVTQSGTTEFASDEEEYLYAMNKASLVLDRDVIPLLKLSVALREFSPAVELFNSMGHQSLVHHKETHPTVNADDCATFAIVGSDLICEAATLQARLKVSENCTSAEMVYEFDHVFNIAHSNVIKQASVALYGSMLSQSFESFYNILKMHAQAQPKFSFVLRHFIADQSNVKHLLVGGYGAEMAIKSTEYNARDDRDGNKVYGDSDKDGDGTGVELQMCTEKETKDLDIQAMELIASAEPSAALETMIDLAQNFPSRIDLLKEVKLPAGKRKGVNRARDEMLREFNLNPDQTYMWVNGQNVDTSTINPYILSTMLRSDTILMHALNRIGVPKSKCHEILVSKAMEASQNIATVQTIDLRTSAVQFYNNLEKDAYTRAWPSQIMMVVRQAQMHQMIMVRKNTLNLIFVVEAMGPHTAMLIEAASRFKQYQIPARVGFIFYTSKGRVDPKSPLTPMLKTSSDCGERELLDKDYKENPSFLAMRVYSYLLQKKSRASALEWLMLANKMSESTNHVQSITASLKRMYETANIDDIYNEKKYDTIREISDKFVLKSNLASDEFIVYANGNPTLLNANDRMLEQGVMTIIREHQQSLVRDVYMQKITDETDLQDYYYENGLSRVSHGADISSVYLGESIPAYNAYTFNPDSIEAQRGVFLEAGNYMKGRPVDGVYTTTHIVVMDIYTREGLMFAFQALLRMLMDDTDGVRMRFAHSLCESSHKVAVAMEIAIQSLERDAIPLLAHVIAKTYDSNLTTASEIEIVFMEHFDTYVFKQTSADAKTDTDICPETHDLLSRDMQHLLQVALDDHSESVLTSIHDEKKRLVRILGRVSEGSRFLIVNGKQIGPLDDKFLAADIVAAEKKVQQSASNLLRLLTSTHTNVSLNDILRDGLSASDVTVRAMALLGTKHTARPGVPRLTETTLGAMNAHVQLAPLGDTYLHTMDIIIDPLSHDAQRIIPQLMAVRESLGAGVNIHLIPTPRLTKLPINRFYRFAIHPKPIFSENGRIQSPSARFLELPSQPVLTMGIDSPPGWSVMASSAIDDLDNIHIQSVTRSSINAIFDITSILLEGHCYESDVPPQGLQLDLGTKYNSHVTDTLVMNNLGYFQLKASAGLWRLAIRPGRSAEIYSMSNGDSARDVFINSFSGRVEQVDVRKLPGYEKVSVLDVFTEDPVVEKASSGIWNSVKNMIGQGTGPERKGDVVNIFSIASGHLYERFLSIMMLSVLKNTNNPVKFWLFENSLSPTFKTFLPKFASDKGFDYELVTYKWPKWLRAQSEKQRIIWGYKILFLDVLFPLDVKRIVFVDADQIVRADLNELMNMDLHGAPYGYTPFCNDRENMKQYRFWDSGYWAGLLGSKMKYHISALYVIDLIRFRQLATGDILRGNYHQLSADPNSLANLDQDLPNSLQPHVKIFSLPQEWLWCETWCSQETKSTAKTIDLCNNPETKEPKLAAAKRIVPEWVQLDAEVQVMHNTVEREELVIHTERGEL